MIILGIETSCDDTAASVIRTEGKNLKVLSSIVSSQVALHARWGGVVPNLAAREHLKNILPVIQAGLETAKIKSKEIDLIAVTQGPGLIPALLVGSSVARTLAYLWKKPLIGIHHIEGHVYANFINEISAISKSQFPISKQISKSKLQNTKINFPILCLVVSGGHTQLIFMNNPFDYKIVGETLDDAAGEAFDKVARILNLGYPGGPSIAKMATKFKIKKLKFKINLPRPMLNSNNLNFSFSGLKTAVLYLVKKNPKILKNQKLIAAVCSEFQQATIDVLVAKTLKAAEKYRPKTVLLAGGVSANLELRKQLEQGLKMKLPGISYVIPDVSYSIDNATMIAAAGYFRWSKMASKQKKRCENNWTRLMPDANLKLK